MQLLVLHIAKLHIFTIILVGLKNGKKRPWTYHSNLEQILFFANYRILGLL